MCSHVSNIKDFSVLYDNMAGITRAICLIEEERFGLTFSVQGTKNESKKETV